jgi:tetratricopeptide (TPR) repeat protein
MTGKITTAALGVAVAGAVAVPAFAQYSQPEAQQSPSPVQTSSGSASAQTPPVKRQVKVSAGAQKAVVALQAAVKAGNYAALPPLVAAAQAVAKTPDDRYVIAQLQLQAAAAAKDEAGMTAGLEALIATGVVPAQDLPRLQTALAKVHYNAKRYDKAGPAIERAMASNPNDSDLLLLLAETRAAQGRSAEAVSLLQRAIDARAASGAKAEESVYRRAVALALKGNLPAIEPARKWIAAYPGPTSWRDGIAIYRNTAKPDDVLMWDTLRLARATGTLTGDNDAALYAYLALENWAAADALKVVDEATAAGTFRASDPKNRELVAALKTAKGRDAASLAASAREVAAAPTGRNALKVGDGFYGIGDYARAVELYRMALSKGSVDANVVNLRIGAALARAGDKAGATAALKAVGGKQAELAKFWMLYLTTRA